MLRPKFPHECALTVVLLRRESRHNPKTTSVASFNVVYRIWVSVSSEMATVTA
jgi:hypothetical protein